VANAQTITSGDANILIIGDSGTKKTAFLGGIPGIYVYDFDKGMATLRGKNVEYDTFRDAPKDSPIIISPLHKFGEGWPAFIKKLNEHGALIAQGKGPKTIGLDSLTFLSELAMNHVVSHQKEGSGIHQGSYGAQQTYIKTVLGQLTAWPIRLVATAHIQRNDNDITGATEKLPLLTGKLAGLISAYFDEVYFTDPGIGSDPVFKTKGTPNMRQAKSRWNVPDGSKMDWAEISKFLPSIAGLPVPATPAK
jgi:DNA replicative helicase MCM subunit Mcm2 (Cdc46/Mcm family)